MSWVGNDTKSTPVARLIRLSSLGPDGIVLHHRDGGRVMSNERVAVVTAGGSGMGAAAARRLAEEGFRVAILSSSGKGEALAAELGGVGVTGSNQSLDDIERLVDATMTRFGRIDALVNSAGHGPRSPLLELSDDDWHAGMEAYFLSA